MYLLVLLYFSLRSIFLLRNGNLQIFDLFFIINTVYYIYKYRKFNIYLFKEFGMFIYYIAIVNLVWAIKDSDLSYLTSIIMYLYNFVFVYVNISLYKRDKYKYKLFLNYGILINILINLVIYLGKFGRNWGDREYLLFGDPNQLSYYFFTMIMISELFDLKHKKVIKIFSVFFMLISSSRMGLVVYLFYEALNLLRNIKKIKFKNIVIIFLISLGIGFYFKEKIYQKLSFTIGRFSEKDDDDSIFSRGWDRIYYYPEYVILGSGEGGFKGGMKYKNASNSGIETHSSWANIILSYGILGIIFFSNIFIKIKIDLKECIYLLPLFVHGMVKVDTRQTVFWLIIFYLAFQKSEKRKIKKFS